MSMIHGALEMLMVKRSAVLMTVLLQVWGDDPSADGLPKTLTSSKLFSGPSAYNAQRMFSCHGIAAS
ncbi:hypothetical protein CYMTET_48663 [Cymbomonas tetramitiformis]|uniref:Secreted protein n=1 Tax=Cymbomonas tetramitiformis TaxID=36881 RepID=A0AAE0BRS7_9CHLO|nr:hypothetical protein CYMTET_48663 [Cymbomonas tetramitiformis]